MRFSFSLLQSFFHQKLPSPEKIGELLTLHSFEVKEIEKIEDDYVLDIDVLPNRAGDCFSHLGIAKEIAAILNLKIKKLETNYKETKKENIRDYLTVEVKNPLACKRYTAKVIKDIKIQQSPDWLAKRLISCGIQPINNVVDVVNYVMLEIGQPMHAFDFEKIQKKDKKAKIIVRNAKKQEKIVTLNNEVYELDKNILVISDLKSPLAIAGIKGGKGTEITESTKMIVLESANFDPVAIRKASRKIDLKTDASLRFEHNLSPFWTEIGIKRVCHLLSKITECKIVSGIIDLSFVKMTPVRIKLPLDYPEIILGMKIEPKEIERILKKLEIKIISKNKKEITIEIPPWRQDLKIPQDLVEEIGRIYGYYKIPSRIPKVYLSLPERNLNVFWENFVKNTLKEFKLTEVYSYSFISKRAKEIFNLKNLLEVENPISSEYQYLRPSLLPNLIEIVQKNQTYFEDTSIFELGKIFKNGQKVEEKKVLGAVFTGDKFFEVKGIVEGLFNKMGIPNIWFDDYQPVPEENLSSLWEIGKSAEIKIDGDKIGFLGEISSEIIKNLKLKKKLVAFEIDFDKIVQLASEEVIYRPVSSYPAVIRDLSILVPIEVKVEEVMNEIENNAGENLIDMDLFDIYEGENLPEGQKSLTFRLVFQAKDRALSSNEVNEIMEKIIDVLEWKGWEVRK
jgi:phenylalanyl-tRNA synthetase beta chain